MKGKRILIDAREFVEGKLTGIGRVLEGLLSALAETDVAAALGTAAAGPEDRERMRQRLTEEATQRDLAHWLEDSRSRARIYYADAANASLPLPFPGPGITR